MIYDCFTLRDELDMLELRLKVLDNYVDKFVISEADKTFTNLPKPFTYHENKERFKQWEDKIIYVPVHLENRGLDFKRLDSKYNPSSAPWQFEYKQRNALVYGLNNVTEDDIILIGDIDEIPNLNLLPTSHLPHIFVQNFYYYYINNKSIGPRDKQWLGTICCRGDKINTYPPQRLRDERNTFTPIHNGGWHLSYMGGKEAIKTKIKTISHTEYNRPEYFSDENINKCLTEGKDVFDRPGMNFTLINLEDEYPTHILNILKQYKDFIHYED